MKRYTWTDELRYAAYMLRDSAVAIAVCVAWILLAPLLPL